MNNITVVKIGGSTLGSHDTTIEDIVTLQQRGESVVVVHGGGSTVTAWMKKLGIEAHFVRGERVTDLPTLEVATAILAGLANKEITSAINIKGGKAVGISGLDGRLIESRARNQEMGYVGDVVRVNTGVLEALLQGGFVPIVSPISLYTENRPVDAVGYINVNGDPIAGEIAAALKAARLIYLTDVDGVQDTKGKPLRRITAGQARELIETGVIAGGMIPKINACLRALQAGAVARIIDGKQSHALLKEMENPEGGTTIEE